MTRLSLLIPLLIISWMTCLTTTAAPTAATNPADQIDLQPCHVAHLAEEARCGVLDVAEDPARPTGRRLALRVVVLPAQTGNAAADPLFLLAGGPGQAATELTGYLPKAFHDVRKRRDLVLVDQRGTGSSNGLDCAIDEPFGSIDDMLPRELIETCRAELDERADLGRYSTFDAMADLDRVRAALGYQRINLWGGSYGTRAALVYESLYPQHVRSLVLDGLAPYSLQLPSYNARGAQRALDQLADACLAGTACQEAFGDPRRTLDRLLANLDGADKTVRANHPRTGKRHQIKLTRRAVASIVRVGLYTPEGSSLLPLALSRALDGNIQPLLAIASMGEAAADMMSLGMTLSVLCTEDVAMLDGERVSAEDLASRVEGTFLGTTEIDSWRTLCDGWPASDLPDDFDQPRASPVPALLLSGDIDPVVPPRWGEQVASQLENSLHVVVPGGGHNVSHLGCVPDLIEDFLDAGSVAELDPSCVDRHQRPPFVIDDAGPRP